MIKLKKVFKRFECKYIISKDQAIEMEKYISEYIPKDIYPSGTIQSLYYDTPNYQLIRKSIEKPMYKEKIRIRTYEIPNDQSNVFLELKKKNEKIVFKRRVELPYADATNFFINDNVILEGQIGREIHYFKKFYQNLIPSFLIIYDRKAYCDYNIDLRITFDNNIRFRTNDLSLNNERTGELILDEDKVLLEIKTCGGYPMWLCKYLSENKIYKTSFSKYGIAYKKLILGR